MFAVINPLAVSSPVQVLVHRITYAQPSLQVEPLPDDEAYSDQASVHFRGTLAAAVLASQLHPARFVMELTNEDGQRVQCSP